MKRTVILTAAALSVAAFSASAQDAANPLRNAYFGETHMHTALSLDAYIGGARLMPSDSLRFAKGEPVVVNGLHKQLSRPLDFAAVTDHVEYLGEMYSTIFSDAPGHLQKDLEQLRNLQSLEEKQQWFFKYVISNNRGDNPTHPPFYMGPETTESGWKIIIDAAEEHNDPGNFTALIGFEWSAAPGGGNMHRNIIFRDNKGPALPLSSYDTNKVEELWQWMQKTSDEDGATLLAIPHNSNASMGGLLPPETAAPVFTLYAEKDADGANLDRIQIIKGWVDEAGDTHEKIVDVSWSGDRTPTQKGKLPAVGNTVDLTTALYTNDIGSSTLIGSWTDPEFDARQHAFYYARALEIPTPRWTTYDAVRNDLPLLPEVPATLQERAWTSPIWYSPAE